MGGLCIKSAVTSTWWNQNVEITAKKQYQLNIIYIYYPFEELHIYAAFTAILINVLVKNKKTER